MAEWTITKDGITRNDEPVQSEAERYAKDVYPYTNMDIADFDFVLELYEALKIQAPKLDLLSFIRGFTAASFYMDTVKRVQSATMNKISKQ